MRVVVYIDGFNLYHGLRAKHDRRYLWLDLAAVAARLVRPGQQLVGVRYFTAAVRNSPVSQANQRVYLEALRAVGGVAITLGCFQQKQAACPRCGESRATYEEKETDVNIAVALLEGAVRDEFDTAILLSADSDLCPAVHALKRLEPDKRIVAVFPPQRRSDDLRRAADVTFTIGDAILRQSLLPEVVQDGDGNRLSRPERWR